MSSCVIVRNSGDTTTRFGWLNCRFGELAKCCKGRFKFCFVSSISKSLKSNFVAYLAYFFGEPIIFGCLIYDYDFFTGLFAIFSDGSMIL
jgi:hypothetical protein